MGDLREDQVLIKKDIYDNLGRIYITKGRTITLSDWTIKKFQRMGIWEQILENRDSDGNEEEKIRFQEKVAEVSKKYEGLGTEELGNAASFVQGIIFEEGIFKRYPHLEVLSEHGQWYYGHSINAAILSVMLAELMGYDKQTIKEIAIGAILHDIGVILLDKDIIDKEDSELTQEEMVLKQKHCNLGVMTMKNANIPSKSQKIIAQHHERLDGTGYPDQLEEQDILEEAHLVTVVETLDTMTSYKNAGRVRSMQEAIQELYNLPEKYSRKYTEVLKGLFKA